MTPVFEKQYDVFVVPCVHQPLPARYGLGPDMAQPCTDFLHALTELESHKEKSLEEKSQGNHHYNNRG